MTKNKKLKFKDIWKTQTEIGKTFNLSAIAVGKKLNELGFKNPDNTPSQYAIDKDVVHTVTNNQGISFYLWRKKEILDMISQTGLSCLHPIEQSYISIIKELESVEKKSKRDPVFEIMCDKGFSVIKESILDNNLKNLSNKQRKIVIRKLKQSKWATLFEED